MDNRINKMPSQALFKVKEDLESNKRFKELVEMEFINKDRLFTTLYQLILDNFKMTNSATITNEQVDLVLNNEVLLSLSDSLMELISKGILEISNVNNKGQFVYKITDLGKIIYNNIVNEEKGRNI